MNEYNNNSKEERKAKGQFFTPESLAFQMVDMFGLSREELWNEKILDPTAGSGNLIEACIKKGADPKKCYANELDEGIYTNVLIPRLTALGVPKENIVNMDVLSNECTLWMKKISGEPFSLNRRKAC